MVDWFLFFLDLLFLLIGLGGRRGTTPFHCWVFFMLLLLLMMRSIIETGAALAGIEEEEEDSAPTHHPPGNAAAGVCSKEKSAKMGVCLFLWRFTFFCALLLLC